MANQSAAGEAADLAALVGGIADDAKALIAQQLELLRSELREGLDQVIGGGVSVAAGAGLTAAGGLLSVVAVAQLLHKLTGLPQWACYGVAAGAAGAAGLALIQKGRNDLAGLRLLPKTTEALGENVTWIRQQAIPAAG